MRHLISATLLALPLGMVAQAAMPDQISEQLAETAAAAAAMNAQQTVEETVEQTVTTTVNSTIENTVTTTVDTSVSATVEESVGQAIGQQVQEVVQESVGNGIGQQVQEVVQQHIADNVTEHIRNGVGNSVSEAVTQTITQGVEDAVRGKALGQAVSSAASGAVAAKASVDALVDEIRIDDHWRAVAQEWLLVLDTSDLARLRATGVRIIDTQMLDELAMVLVRVRVTEGHDSYEAVKAIVPHALSVDRNHVYDFKPQSGQNTYKGKPLEPSAAICTDPVSIGVVDTGVNMEHPLLQGAHLEQGDFRPVGAQASMDHGSAVAGLLVARGIVKGLVPNAKLAVAAVMYQRKDGSQGATALSLVQALNWLVKRDVQVINLSLAGPPNRIVERAIQQVTRQGVTVVAAVGNAGPAAPPLYPAAYSQVIGATAVDREQRIYRWANRGDQVDFAAPGVGIKTLQTNGLAVNSGTSMAAPIVSAFAACLNPHGAGSKTEALLAARAVDLGDPGRDTTYGIGLLPMPVPQVVKLY